MRGVKGLGGRFLFVFVLLLSYDASNAILSYIVAGLRYLTAGNDDYSNNVLFHLYNNVSNVDESHLLVKGDRESLSFYDKSKQLVVIIHGFYNSKDSAVSQRIKNALLGLGHAVNVIVVDWSHYAMRLRYAGNAPNRVPLVGDYVGQFVNFLIEEGVTPASNVHIIGHSLGAHVAGFAGKSLIRLGHKIGRITGLDPALPGFDRGSKSRISSKDADFVDCIHTRTGDVGFHKPICQADYFPNGGEEQPGCTWWFDIVCFHARSFEYFAESVDNTHHFYAVKCNIVYDGTPEECNNTRIAEMGYYAKPQDKGSYYLKTASRWPYALNSTSWLDSSGHPKHIET